MAANPLYVRYVHCHSLGTSIWHGRMSSVQSAPVAGRVNLHVDTATQCHATHPCHRDIHVLVPGLGPEYLLLCWHSYSGHHNSSPARSSRSISPNPGPAPLPHALQSIAIPLRASNPTWTIAGVSVLDTTHHTLMQKPKCVRVL